MEIRPVGRIFQIRVHPRERTRHRPTPAYFKPCDCLKLFAATLSWVKATLMNFESLPHLYHFVEDFFGVIDSRLPPMPTAPAADEPSARLRSPSSSPGPPRIACTSLSVMPGSILSKLACVSFL